MKKGRARFFFALLFLFALPQLGRGFDGVGIVKKNVADVRSSSGSAPSAHTYDPLEETQLLYNERVVVLEKTATAYRIEAIEQSEFSHQNAWQGYPGWVEASAICLKCKKNVPNFVVIAKEAALYPKPEKNNPVSVLSMGTRIYSTEETRNGFWQIITVEGKKLWIEQDAVRLMTSVPEEFMRQRILSAAAQLLGAPYFWGGRSAHLSDENVVSSVDCSGLTNLAYRTAGIDIPRDALEQWMTANKVTPDELLPGDLIFSAPIRYAQKISHVGLWLGEGKILEAPQSGEFVRVTTFKEKYGINFDDWDGIAPLKEHKIYLGSYFPLANSPQVHIAE